MSDGTSVDPASVLFGLEDEFSVLGAQGLGDGSVRVVIEQLVGQGGCPGCGVLLSAVIKERPLVRLKDLPVSGQRVELWWRKRRLVCAEPACARRSFTQTAVAVRPPRARLTERLRAKLASAIATANRAVSGVADEYGVSWPDRAQGAGRCGGWVVARAGTDGGGGDRRNQGAVGALDPGGGGLASLGSVDDVVRGLLDRWAGIAAGLTPGRSGQCVKDWLGEQTAEFRDRIEIVVIDPSAPYASGIRAALPDVRIAVDKFHLVQLAHQMVTEVRQRLTRTRYGRCGTAADPIWANRRMLLTGADRLTAKQWCRLGDMLDHHDPTDEIGAAWGVKERLRMLLGETEPSKIRWRLADFYEAAIDSAMPETDRLATTIETWWPAILVALTERVSNARTEGFNRITKQVKRAGCGYRNMINYERRILTHIAVTRPRWSAA